MKSLVIFDSNFGNTKIIAETLAKALGAQSISISEFSDEYLNNIDLVIVGSPIIGWKPTEKMIAFLSNFNKNQFKGIKATTFDTRVKLFIHGDAKDKIAKSLIDAGAEILISPEAFYVQGKEGPLLTGEIDKAVKWAKLISTKFSL